MATSTLKDIKIMGEGTYPGGTYKKVRINGQGKINGNLECNKIKIFGDSRFNGDVKVQEFSLFGAGHVKESLDGSTFEIFGSLDVGKKVTGDVCSVRGSLSSVDAIEMDKLTVNGGLRSEGLLNVGELTMKLGHFTSRVKEIGGEKITIKGKRVNLFGKQQELVADSIEGDRIYLEFTTAKVVRGNKITLGRGCNIDHLEYRQQFKAHKTSSVGNVSRI
ncbi:hypothetical protein [Sutcliffiella rhizosphaerae]|uniref:Polymer-forming cytoskeletal protein n=1 Tax=Sutcliffiella rhizosphaerae TaxID=2880967 RepID=A0ABN8A4C3_9BACI|nr:hypothetical protein [Sutcliffiella rhizosphaerae]CAG9619974.1 hypothetical protein BACCIP111883_00742 [Sutcliffiella rhizosphaerae]